MKTRRVARTKEGRGGEEVVVAEEEQSKVRRMKRGERDTPKGLFSLRYQLLCYN